MKVAELLRVKGLVEGEGEKLLNPHIGKNGRPLVSTSMSDPPTSSSKLNGNGNDLRDRSEERRPTSDSKESPNGVPPGMPRFMPGMPQLPMPFGLPGMFPSLLGKNVFFLFLSVLPTRRVEIYCLQIDSFDKLELTTLSLQIVFENGEN